MSRSKFRTWTQLEEIRDQISRAVSVDILADKIYEYLTTALSLGNADLDTVSWEDTAVAFTACVNANSKVKILPFMRYKKTDDKPVPYDYYGRMYYHYAHTLANSYGWSSEYIAELDVDDAFAFIQEILITKNLEREWQWDISPNSIGYDTSAKKSKHIPFPLPDWMQPEPPAPKIYKIPKSLLPVGNVISFRNVEPS